MWHSTPMQMHWVVHFILVWLVCLCSLVIAAESTWPNPISEIGESSPLQKRDNATFLLRIMPLGASITLGYRSTDHNGYRKALRQQLRYAGWQVDMIGSLRNGTMHNNHHEGHYGYRIDQLESKIQESILQKPNLILINAGTNDALQNHQIPTAGHRMNTLLTTLYTAIPDTTIILSTLLPNKKQPDRVDQISSQYRALVALRRQQGYRIVLADMSTFITVDQLVDGTHPDDDGYRAMAAVWWAAFREVVNEGFLEVAAGTGDGGRVSVEVEGELDGGDSIGDPELPSYTAPVQAGATSTMGSAGASVTASGSVKSTVKSGGVGRVERRGIGVVSCLAFVAGISLALLVW